MSSEIKSLRVENEDPAELYRLLTGCVGPRPIALVATVSASGACNLAPFSFFNLFGINPPILGFSPTRRLRDGSFKDTYNNIVKTRECTVQVVTREMLEQVNICAGEFPQGVDEFSKSGFHPVPSVMVRPPRVKESPVQFECTLEQMIPLGDKRGSGNLALCKIVMIHVTVQKWRESWPSADELRLVGRCGGQDYVEVSPDSRFSMERPPMATALGLDGLPQRLRDSKILAGWHLARLATAETMPDRGSVMKWIFGMGEPPHLKGDKQALKKLHQLEQRGEHRSMFEVVRWMRSREHPRCYESLERTLRTAIESEETDFAWLAASWWETDVPR